MAAFEIPSAHPNILIVYGTDVYHRNASGVYDVDARVLQDYFSGSLAGSPVSRFSHDFWITHPIRTEVASYVDDSVIHEPDTAVPGRFRDFRGIVKLGLNFTSLDNNVATNYLRTFLKEIGHYWLVPADMTFGGRRLTTANEFTDAFINRRSLPELQLLGRNNNNWSTNIELNASPMEGKDWVPFEEHLTEGLRSESSIMTRYPALNRIEGYVDIPGAGRRIEYTYYSELDRVIMGIIPKEESFPRRGNAFYELNPVWLSGSNMHGGLVVVFNEANVVTFGFAGGITHSSVRSTGGFHGFLPLEPFYKPWLFMERIVFRVVRKDNDYYFQAKSEIGTIGCLATILRAAGLYTAPPPTDFFADAETPGPPDPFAEDLQIWRTIGVITSNSPPIAIGYGCRTWSPAPFVDMNFKPLKIKVGDTILPEISTDPAGINTVTGSYISTLNNSNFTFHRPTTNPRLTGDTNSCYITMTEAADNSPGIDNMPKLLVRPPQGNFIAAGSIEIFRSAVPPWANYDYDIVEQYAFKRRIQMSGLQLNPQTDYRRVDPRRAYKAAFMLVAERREDITDTMIENLDKLRIACESVFYNATDSARVINTRLA
jgi:hypothetical protein